MIKIEINNETRKEMELLHWKWFFYRSKEKYNNKAIKEARSIKKILGLKHIKEIKSIVIGNYNQLEYFKNTIKQINNNDSNHEKIKDYFGYENFQKGNYQSIIKWDAYKFTKKLQINVCPYCNRQYIFTIKKHNKDGKKFKRITAPEIDHFFPKSLYPYLSGSLYNFIPSCHSCNHGKREFGDNIIYPYDEEFDKDIPFRVKFDKDSGESDNLVNIKNAYVFFEKIKCRGLKSTTEECRICKRTPKIKASIETFHLKEIYNEHKIDLKDLFDRYRNYSKPKIDEITKLILNETLDTNDLDLNKQQKEKLYQKVASTYTKRIKRTILGLPLGAEGKEYPLRKFKEDIIEQLDETARNMKK